MKKLIPIALGAALITGLFSGCGYSADENTLFILKNGKIVSTDVDEFDTEKYGEEEFPTYVDDVIANYNATYGEDSVTLKKLKIKDSVVTLTLQYATAADYMAFTSYRLYTGTVQEAQDAGFPFTGNFAAIKSGEAELCGADEFMDSEKYKVVILESSESINVQVPGKILYATADYVKLVDNKTIYINSEYNLLAEADTESLGTESATEAIITTETGEEVLDVTETEEEGGTVSDDDLLTAATETSEEETEEEEEEEKTVEETAAPDYIYIIYK